MEKKNWVEEVVGKKMAAVFLVELDGVAKADLPLRLLPLVVS